jgi:hypothetical protein
MSIAMLRRESKGGVERRLATPFSTESPSSGMQQRRRGSGSVTGVEGPGETVRRHRFLRGQRDHRTRSGRDGYRTRRHQIRIGDEGVTLETRGARGYEEGSLGWQCVNRGLAFPTDPLFTVA